FTGKQDDPALSRFRLLPSSLQQLHLFCATDQRHHFGGTQRLEPALHHVLAQNRHAEMALSKPLSAPGSTASHSNTSPVRRRVLAAISTVLGAAADCRRAARFGVSPTTLRSCAAPLPTSSPTTTIPVAMPMRTDCRTSPTVSPFTASIIANAARTAFSASV